MSAKTLIPSLLIANRGEIACRIIATARRLGVRAIAVYSEADAGARHVRLADEAIAIGPAPARESYLDGAKIIAAARQSGAAAIHPGYGFLSENADFAQSVIDAGLIWVGPNPASIRAMGLKDAAKALMARAGVPVTPGYLGDDQSPERLRREADAIAYPVLIKAVAGGGGKGMRRVDAAEEFADALASCQREARASFGDDRVLIEKYIQRPRHIEVQIFGDTRGNIVHLFERDCSLQRRHQKVVEEAPAPGMDDATRAQLCAAAVTAARAVDYVGAGTIEFIADASGGLRADRIWFMEMNTRLQVEHPVTEMITGQDLVEWQLRVASGEPLPLRQEELAINGHAVEVRLYAEDPTRGFLPAIGTIDEFAFPHSDGRVDSGVAAGDAVTPWYDPMIAKLISHHPDRREAIATLAGMIDAGRVGPLVTNAGFLHRLLLTPEFLDGDVDTGFIERNLGTLAHRPEPSASGLSAAAGRLAGPVSDWPWTAQSGFRLNAPARRTVMLADQFGALHTATLPPEASTAPAETMALLVEGGERYELRWPRVSAAEGEGGGDGALRAPMPGRVIALEVETGQSVARGARLLVLEAMKMEHALTAPFDGIITELAVRPGDQVGDGALLITIEQSRDGKDTEQKDG